MSVMQVRLPLPALLSQALVAFIIELDNEFENRMPHRTTNHGSTQGMRDAPWLVSIVMWWRFMRFVGSGGIRADELQRLLRISRREMNMWLTRLGSWWGYLSVEMPEAKSRSARIPPHAVVRPTKAGCKAQAIWGELETLVEKRWEERFGRKHIDTLRRSLRAVASQLDADLPDCLPILGYGLSSTADQKLQKPTERQRDDIASVPMAALLSKVLLAFAFEFERESEVSLAIGANVLRLVQEKGTRVKELPGLAAVSKEAIAMALNFLEKRGYATIKPELPASRVKVVLLTSKGQQARSAYCGNVEAIERRWLTSFGEEAIGQLRESLERLVGDSAQLSPLLLGLEPYPGGWRAAIPKPEGLPHFPMILHRGGFPDGS